MVKFKEIDLGIFIFEVYISNHIHIVESLLKKYEMIIEYKLSKFLIGKNIAKSWLKLIIFLLRFVKRCCIK